MEISGEKEKKKQQGGKQGISYSFVKLLFVDLLVPSHNNQDYRINSLPLCHLQAPMPSYPLNCYTGLSSFASTLLPDVEDNLAGL